ncbi:hypothetical protein [Streptomyces sp. NPDC058011]|uniref:hypothetical protein n=1 Tax=Streptomyces sp. NPDC058011 TaxID=3346305 RepID=UPI0036DFC6C9
MSGSRCSSEPVAVGDAAGHQEDPAGGAVAAPQEGDGPVAGVVVELLDERRAGTGGLGPEGPLT